MTTMVMALVAEIAAIVVLLAVVLRPIPTGAAQTTSSMVPDVDRLVRAAGTLVDTWPAQPPPAVPEVTMVARHGRAVVPLLMTLLADPAKSESDRQRWKAQQQVSLALSAIYSEPAHCGRIYCDGDPPERIAHLRAGWLRVIASDKEMRALSVRSLLDRFKDESVFWRQLEIAKALGAANDRRAIADLEAWLTHEDRHLRGNVALVLGRLGDPRGFDTIVQMLADRSERPPGQGGEGRSGGWSAQAQIRSDRYYAAHLLGLLKDPRGLDVLIPLLDDEDVSYTVPWSLAEIGDRRAIDPLIAQLDRDEPSARILAIHALEQLKAREAYPTLRALLRDGRRSNVAGLTTVAEGARHAIATIAAHR
jgi:HEAT repeat protein